MAVYLLQICTCLVEQKRIRQSRFWKEKGSLFVQSQVFARPSATRGFFRAPWMLYVTSTCGLHRHYEIRPGRGHSKWANFKASGRAVECTASPDWIRSHYCTWLVRCSLEGRAQPDCCAFMLAADHGVASQPCACAWMLYLHLTPRVGSMSAAEMTWRRCTEAALVWGKTFGGRS